MHKSIRSDHTTKADKLSVNQHETQHSPIWFHHEDINDTHEPQLHNLLSRSFKQWINETAHSPLSSGCFAVCDKEGRIVALNRELEVFDRDSREIAELEELALAASRADKLLESEHAIAKPIEKRSLCQVFAVLVWIPGIQLDGAQALLRAAALHLRSVFYHLFEFTYVQNLLIQQQASDKEAIRRDTLIQVAKRLHDQNDVSSVLNVLLMDLEHLYPHAKVDLYLSQDHVNGDPRVKPLLIRHAATDTYVKAFLDGKPIVEHRNDNLVELAIPMSGKQAVYGVLSITMNSEYWDDADMRALIMLSDTAGSAFENAKLFEQSNLLIGELQLINELTKRLNQSLRLNEIFEFAMTELRSIFNADFCNLLQLKKEMNTFQVVSSNLPAAVNEIYSTEYGFCGVVYETKEPLIISDYHTTRVVDSQLMDVTGSRSLIAAPIMANTEVLGVIMVSHQSPNYFSYDNYKLLQVLSTHIGLAISNASLHAAVRRMVITDNLTGLHARHYLNEQIQSRQRKDPSGSLILVDIDNFKKVNDTYGHQIGDRILIAVSDVIRSCIRESDIAARWGGEELAVYLPQIRAEQAYRIAERIRCLVEEQTEPSVTVSCGISEWIFEDEKVSVESLFYRADMALYEAKNNGRNRIFLG
ncbi:sensor domain-containing diguanylate cyclase [Paenibacillus solisilvae]|uniref:Sensor domain-containing diguanylate cyclase n=1 Tax=Paenibacillus solisilvae TaxID=2486751 RepID=A0ABW0W5X6_9BACL